MQAIIPVLLICTLATAQNVQNGQEAKFNTGNPEYSVKWKTNPFDRQLFIENQGQFDVYAPNGEKVIFASELSDCKILFTSNKIIYYHETRPKTNETAERDPDEVVEKPEVHYLEEEWVGANPSATLSVQNEQSYYYTYPVGAEQSIKANVFKKLIYNNIYPGIDIEFFYLKKGGIKYNIIVHPGADASLVKLKIRGQQSMSLNSNGDVVIQTEMGQFIDHAPNSYFSSNKTKVPSAYKLNGDEESFSIGLSSSEITIDPWKTDPFAPAGGGDKAYDVDYDNAGNVYAYGSVNPFQLVKMNSAGTIQWVYNAATLVTYCYGDFVVDRKNGTCYLTEGFDASGAKAVKVNTLGTQLATWPGSSNLNELWRDAYDPCTGKIVCGAGGTGAAYQACVLDTTLLTLTPQNVMGVTQAYHDVCLLAVDPDGKTCYMASTLQALDTGNANNFIFKLPVPGLVPPVMSARDGFHFLEDGTVGYIGTGGYYANGYNGIAATPNWLYLYDGAYLEKMNKNTGAILSKLKISGRVNDGTIQWNLFSGGLDADICDNVYVGYDSAVTEYNSAFSVITSLVVPTSITYEVKLDTMHKCMYVGGDSAVISMTLPASAPPTIIKKTVASNCGACNGTAKATLQFCGNLDTNGVNYKWSDGQTTETATNLCPGTYTVTISFGIGCNSPSFTDTVNVNSSGGGTKLAVTPTIVNVKCNGGSTGSVSLAVSTGLPPYTYLWSPSGNTTNSLTGLSAGTYTCYMKDKGCSSDTDTITITQPPLGIAKFVADSTVGCSPLCVTFTDSSFTPGGPKSWAWSFSDGSTSTQQNPRHCFDSAGIYSVSLTVTSDSGCVTAANTPNMITVYSSPKANFAINPAAAQVGTPFSFIDKSTDAYGITNWFWNLRDNPGDTGTATSILQNPTYTYMDTGTHCAKLIVTNSKGCIDSAVECLEVESFFTLYVPNSFTPNNDGMNDVFMAKGTQVCSFSMDIFDRWGQHIFTSNSINNGWDGRARTGGDVIQQDTYVYIIKAVDCLQMREHSYVGRVTLIR